MNRLKELRILKGLSQKEIAKVLNITQGNYSRWESGQIKIGNESLKRLSSLYNVSIDYLLGNSLDVIQTNDDKEILELIRELNQEEKNKAKAYIKGMIDSR